MEDGVLDLSTWDARALPTFPVRGTVEFHWQYFLKKGEEHPETLSYIRFPGLWNLVDKQEAFGFASYRFRVKVPSLQPISLRFTPPWTAAHYYVEGRLVHTVGQPSKTAGKTRAGQLRPYIYSFTPKSNEFEVLVQASNFDLFGGGFGGELLMGTVNGVMDKHDTVTSRGLFLMGAITIMGFYHIALFGLRRTDFSTLYYGLFCLFAAMHLSVADPSNPFHVFFNGGFTTQIRFYNMGWMFATAAFILYSQQLFPKDMARRVPWVILGISLLHVAFVMTTSVRTFILSTLFYQGVTAIGALYTLYAVVRAARRQREGAKTFLFASFLLFLCTAHDMMVLQGFFNSPPLGSLGALLFTFGQSFLLSMRFAKAFTRAETSEAEVRNLNHSLEDRVQEQTRDIHSIMEHIRLGIFTIEGDAQTIHKDYSTHLERLLEAQELSGQPALPLLFAGSSLKPDERDRVLNALSSTLGQNEINFFTNEHMLPHSITRQRRDGQIRQLELGWNPIVKENDEVEKILVTVNDATELRKLETIAREQSEDLTIVGEILSCKEDAFRRFLRNCREFNQQNRELIRHADPERCDPETLKIIFMNMHTMKGAARTLQFKKLTEIFHDLEQYYSNLARQDEAVWDLGLMQRDVDMIDEVADHYEALAKEKLGRSLGAGPHVSLAFDPTLAGFQKLERFAHIQELQPLHRLLQDALFNSLDKVVADILTSTVSLAKDLGKPTPHTHRQIPELWVSHKAEDLLRNTFVHLLRNSMDHGIEFPAEREAQGRKAEGNIHLEVEHSADAVIFWLWDDGRGLNLPRLMKIGQDRNLLPPGNGVSKEKIAEVIFAAGVSTAQALTDISGRGVGMSAVRKYYEDAGGSIAIHFQDDARFRFCITLPRSLFSTVSSKPGTPSQVAVF